MTSVFRTSKIVAICLPEIRFSTSGSDLPLLALENADSVLPGDVETDLLAFVDDVIEMMDDRFSLFDENADVTDVAFIVI